MVRFNLIWSTVMLKFPVFFAAVMPFAVFASPPASITDKGSISQKASVVSEKANNVRTEQININGLQGGKVTSSGNKLIVKGGTITAKPGQNQNKPLIEIKNPRNKEIYIENTRIITDGFTQDNKDGSAGVVVVENGKRKNARDNSKVHMKNVHVESRNSEVNARATSSSGSIACAGVVCTDEDVDSKVIVKIKGKNKFKAVAK